MLVALVVSIGSFILVAWIIPGTKEALRIAFTATLGVEGPAPRAATELTLGELSRLLDRGEHDPAALPFDRRSIELTYHKRWALACTPFVLAMFSLTLTGRDRRGRWPAGFAGGAIIFGYLGLDMAAQVLLFSRSVPVLPAVWIPNGVFLMLAVARTRRKTRRGAPLRGR